MTKRSESQGVLSHVGANVRHFRDVCGLSQQALADASGVSRRTIAALEAGEANISLAKLALLAEVLKIDFGTLVSPPERRGSRQLDVETWRGKLPGSLAMLHCSAPAKREAELWSWALAPGERYDAEPDPEGWSELLYIIEGTLTLEINGSAMILPAGASIAYASSVQYAYVNAHGDMVRFIRNVVV